MSPILSEIAPRIEARNQYAQFSILSYGHSYILIRNPHQSHRLNSAIRWRYTRFGYNRRVNAYALASIRFFAHGLSSPRFSHARWAFEHLGRSKPGSNGSPGHLSSALHPMAPVSTAAQSYSVFWLSGASQRSILCPKLPDIGSHCQATFFVGVVWHRFSQYRSWFAFTTLWWLISQNHIFAMVHARSFYRR